MGYAVIDGDEKDDVVSIPEITREDIAKVKKVARKKRCKWFGCPHPHHAKGWCMRHYQQKRRGIIMR